MPSYLASDLSAVERALRLQRSALAAALHARTHQADAPNELAMANYFNSTDDRAEAASMSDDDIAQLQHAALSLRQVDAALGRLADGNYGLCAACSEPIAAARLLAALSTTLCLACQSRAEKAMQR